MDDFSEKLDRLLSSPDTMKRVEEMMSAFSADATAPSVTPPSKEASFDISGLMGLLPLVGQFGASDDSADLLKALRPHLQSDRQKKLDEAAQILKLIKILPLLKMLTQTGDDDRDT